MSLDELLKCLKKSRLLTEKQLALVQKSIGASKKPLTPGAVTDQLVKQELITEWQAKMLLQKQTGFVLGQYRLLKPIGQGGMGKVFKAWDRKSKQTVAIKVLSKKLAKKKKLVARFQREIDLASKLNSPYIVRTVDAGTIGQSHFMVMEYVDGESIDEIAKRQGRMKAEHACELARQAALGLQDAHAAGMVHRDIKPGNLMVAFADGKLSVKLLDMGLARLNEQENDGMTKTGQVMGTPDYMAPEQGWNTADVDIRADIYSLGCTLFRLVTGGVPFPGDNPLQILMARCSTDAPLASAVVPDLDPRIDAAIRGMTWRDPGQRFQTPQEVADALAQLSVIPAAKDLQGGTGTASPSAQPTMVQGATTQGEPSFKEFLSDMDSGAKVELMTGGSTEEFETTKPSGARPQSGVSKKDRHQKPNRKKNKGLLWAGIAFGALLLTAGGFLVLNSESETPQPEEETQVASQQPATVEYFAQIPIQRAEPGQVVRFFATPEITTGLDDVKYFLGAGSPEAATLDAETGEFYWVPPRDQSSGRLTLKVQAKRGEKVESERDVLIDILAAQLMAKIIEFENKELKAGTPWTYSLELFGQDTKDVAAEFRLIGNPPEGLKLDQKTGALTWTPLLSQVGRHPLSLQLIDPADGRVVHSATCSLLVQPGSNPDKPLSAIIAAQTVEAGRQLSVDLRKQASVRIPARAVWALVSPKDTGASVNQQTSEFVWTPPEGSTGKTVFNFNVSLAGRSGTASLEVNVTAPAAATTTMTAGAVPPASEVTEAEAHVRDIFKRDFAQRGATAKRELASKLLVRAFDDNPPAMEYALLKLGFEVAREGKAFATGAEIVQLMAAKFGSDSVAQTAELVDGFKARGVKPMDKTVLGEVMFRESYNAANQDRFQSAAAFIKVGGLIAKSGPYADVVKEAASRLKSLPTDSDEPGALDEKQQVAKGELIALLNRYQFAGVFREPASLIWIQNDEGDPGAGKDLWNIRGPQILMESPQSAMITGFVDPSVGSDGTIIRLQIAADSTTGMLLLGTPNSGQVFGYQVPLAGSEMLFVKQSNLAQPLARPQGRIVRDKSGWDLVEIAVAGETVRISFNGTPVTEASLPEAALGSTGLLTVLKDGSGDHKLHIRNVRILKTGSQ